MPAIQRWPVLAARTYRLHQLCRPNLALTRCLARPTGHYGYATKTTMKKSTKASAARKSREAVNNESIEKLTRNEESMKSHSPQEIIKSEPILLKPSEARYNEVGVQQLSKDIHSQIFGKDPEKPLDVLVELSKAHLRQHDLLGKNTDNSSPIAFDLPKLQGASLDEHFSKIGMDTSEPYLSLAKEFARSDCSTVMAMPRSWVEQSGWTMYPRDGSEAVQVDAPRESMLTFDVEVLYKISPFAVIACAISDKAWYAWISPWVMGESEEPQHLIPMGDPTKERIIVGHNIGYDRARILEEYNIEPTRNAFLDTMSLHVAVNGMCSRQRPTWMKHRKDQELRDKITEDSDSMSTLLRPGNDDLEAELWVGKSSVNSLRDVAKFHCKVAIDKSMRNAMAEMDEKELRSRLTESLDYCAADVAITHRVFKAVLPGFLNTCPHPVSFGALRHMSSVRLPVNKSWDEYIKNAEDKYNELLKTVQDNLIALAEKAVELKDKPDEYSNDEWLRQLDWGGQEIRMLKQKKKDDLPKQAAKQKLPGKPKWYKDLHPTSTSPINLTVRTRIAPILLRLSWDGYPLIWTDKHGWTFKVPNDEVEKYHNSPLLRCSSSSLSEEPNQYVANDTDCTYFKLPHNGGATTKCSTPLAKSFQVYFENNTLSSEFDLAKEAIQMNSACSYWISARERIKSQMVVWDDVAQLGLEKSGDKPLGMILPQVVPMGTITRRAVENTWLTASNAKKDRVGSELKAMIQAPPGYVFVGADVDSEELWIASLVGDAQFKLHGGNAIGFMTLEGTKAAGTDLHSRTAEVLGISRNDAKVFNYGRIYGAGLKFATTLLRRFNPSTTEQEAQKTAENLYTVTKGKKTTKKALYERGFWRGGTESFVFNKLEEFAEQQLPRTPVLGAGITEALMARNINKGGFMTSRINWAIQSSGVDYLHLLIVSMDYLTRLYNINARLALTVHDEIRYLVKEEDKYRAAMALQVSNLWTRAMFAQQMGIDDLPQSCAFFSAIDIDHVLRKEVNMDCITPSHPSVIEHGESIDIIQLLGKGAKAQLSPDPEVNIDLSKYSYEPRIPVMQDMGTKTSNIHFLRAQSTSNDKELASIIRDYQKSQGVVTNDGEVDAIKPAQRTKSSAAKRDPETHYGERYMLDPELGFVDSENHDFRLWLLDEEIQQEQKSFKSNDVKRPIRMIEKKNPFKTRRDLPQY